MTSAQTSMLPPDYLAAQVEAMTEAELSEKVRVMCEAFGLMAFHTRDSRGTRAGYPDWHIVAPGRGHMWRELKSNRGRLTPEQSAVLDALHNLGEDANVWRPEDWYTGRIRDELVELARRHR